MKTMKYLILTGVAIVLIMKPLSATCTQYIAFKGQKVDFTLILNVGDDGLKNMLMSTTKQILPFIIGLENHTEQNEKIKLIIGCQQHGKTFFETDKKKQIEISCEGNNYAPVKTAVKETLMIDISEEFFYSVFTIALKNTFHLNAAENKMTELKDSLSFESVDQVISISGDRIQSPIWATISSKDSYCIQFGIFSDSISALQGADSLGLNKKDIKIKKVTIAINNLEDYFR